MVSIALFTYGSPGIRIIEKFFEEGYDPEQIMVPFKEDPLLARYCEQNNIHGIRMNPDILISFYWRSYIQPHYIYTQPSINFHPSLLPQFRGCNSIPQAILHEAPIGWTWHHMTEEIDGGDIILQKEIPYSSTDTAHNLYFRMVSEGVNSVIEAIDLAMKGERTPQKGESSYFPRHFPAMEKWMDPELYRRASHFPTKYPGK